MNDINILFDLAKRVRTPKEALSLLMMAAAIVAIIYLIPGDAIDQ